MKILVKFPTRSRPAKFLQTLQGYIDKAADLSNVTFLVTYDDDDATMNNSAILNKLEQLQVHAIGGSSKSKIHAINRDMDMALEWDICMLASDDMICQVHGWDERLREEMKSNFPDTDGCLWFHDGDQATKNGGLCTMCILGRKYYDRFGYIYHPAYISLWSDNEYTEIARRLNKLKFFEEVLFKHVHFSNTSGLQPDALMIKTQSYFKQDEATYREREGRNFDLPVEPVSKIKIIVMEAAQPRLSILIPTVIGREEKFNTLIAFLKKQAEDAGLILGLDVEIKHAKDNKQISIGKKRQLLYQAAKGLFSVMIDDDDWVADDFVQTIHSAVLKAIEHKADCIGYHEHCIFDGSNQKISDFSLRHDNWSEASFPDENGFSYYRTPFCKTPILTKLCMQAGVPDMRFGEDHEFARRVYQLLQKEIYVNRVMYHYRYNAAPHAEKYGITKKQFI